MKVCGIIAEYNPLHNGHARQLHYVREKLSSDYIVICMSGDFVQRGEPAILDKYARTRMALSAGADLVLELPAANACGSAEFFASAGASLLDSAGIVDSICFGCESAVTADPDPFLQAAALLNEEPPEYRQYLQEGLSRGMSFPEARKTAVTRICPEALSLIESPNNILGVEYCRSLLKRGSRITPCPLLRSGSPYLSEEWDGSGFPSAAAVRKYIRNSAQKTNPPGSQGTAPGCSGALYRAMPDECASLLLEYAENRLLLFPGDFDRVMFYQLLKEDQNSITGYQDVTPELGRRILKLRSRFRSFEQFALLVKSRNYTLTRVQRALLHILLGIREIHHEAGYARILGFRRSSAPLLSELRKKSRIPLVSRPSDFSFLNARARADYELTVQAADLYESQACLKSGRPFLNEFQRPMIVMENREPNS